MASTSLECLPTLQGKLVSEGIPSKASTEEIKSQSRPVSSFADTTVRDTELDVCEEEIQDENLQAILLGRVDNGDDDAKFLLGQLFFCKQQYAEALELFQEIEDSDPRAKYQLAVMYYDGLGVNSDYLKAVEYMKTLANCKDPNWQDLVACAQYNLGRAYYEGFGVAQSDDEAEFWWILSARDGDPDGSVQAQSALGMFYSRIGEHSFNLKKAHFWHQEATGNGSIESQAALGVMYCYGLSVEKNLKISYQCFRSAAERGNIYAIGNMAFYYYKQKLYNNAVDFSQRVVCIENPESTAKETNCLLHYVKKGIALGCFVYARCLSKGFGIKMDIKQASNYYSKSAEMDLDVANQMQDLMIQGSI